MQFASNQTKNITKKIMKSYYSHYSTKVFNKDLIWIQFWNKFTFSLDIIKSVIMLIACLIWTMQSTCYSFSNSPKYFLIIWYGKVNPCGYEIDFHDLVEFHKILGIDLNKLSVCMTGLLLVVTISLGSWKFGLDQWYPDWLRD